MATRSADRPASQVHMSTLADDTGTETRATVEDVGDATVSAPSVTGVPAGGTSRRPSCGY